MMVQLPGVQAYKHKFGAALRVHSRSQANALYRAAALLPFLATGVVQLVIGCNPLVLGLYIIAAIAGIAPFAIFGFDLFTLIPLMYFLLYLGIGSVAKSLMGQPLQTLLNFPVQSFLMAGATVAMVASVTLFLRAFDRKAAILKLPPKLDEMRTFGWLCTGVGGLAAIANLLTVSRVSGIANTGAIPILASGLINFLYLGVACETTYLAKLPGKTRLLSIPLMTIFFIALMSTLLVNKRTVVATTIVCYGLTLLLTRSLRPKHVAMGAIAISLFLGIISPVVLASRAFRFSGGGGDFAKSVGDSAYQAVTDRSYLKVLQADQLVSARGNKDIKHYDYFGGNQGILNRISFVGLVDEIVTDMRGRSDLGTEIFPELFGPLIPRFLYPDKEVARSQPEDALSVQIGMEKAGNFGALNFPINMEGYVIFGAVGFVLYQTLGSLGIYFCLTKLSSFRFPTPVSIALFCCTRELLFEGLAYHYLAILTRTLPIYIVTFFLLHVVQRALKSTFGSANPSSKIYKGLGQPAGQPSKSWHAAGSTRARYLWRSPSVKVSFNRQAMRSKETET